MIISISGLSGTGKSTVAKHLSDTTDIPIVIRDTNRPIRPGEIDGVDYNFVTDFNPEDYIGVERFEVAGGDVWWYGSKKSNLKEKCIMVINPTGIEKLKESYDGQIIDIMVRVEESERLKRILYRKDNQSKDEILRRSSDDLKIFENYKPTFVFTNDESPLNTALFIRYVLVTYGLV